LSFRLSLFLSLTLPIILSLLSQNSLDCFSFLLSPMFFSCSLSLLKSQVQLRASALHGPPSKRQHTHSQLTLLSFFVSSSTPFFLSLYFPVCCVHFHSLFLAIYICIIGRIKNDSICLVVAVRFFVRMHPRAASTHIYIKLKDRHE